MTKRPDLAFTIMLAFWLQSLDGGVNSWAAGLGWPLEPMLRLALAVLLGGLVGLEREVRGRQAGFRTNLLVCLGSALAMVVSISFAHVLWQVPAGTELRVDPARVAYSVLTGIGFLGAGVIIKHDGGVRGLTTAAGLWCIAAIGLAAGLGLYVVSVAATVLVLGALWTLKYFEKLLPRIRYRTITVRRAWHAGVIGETIAMLEKDPRVAVVDSSFQRLDNLTKVDIAVRLSFTSLKHYYQFERELDQRQEIELIASSEG